MEGRADISGGGADISGGEGRNLWWRVRFLIFCGG